MDTRAAQVTANYELLLALTGQMRDAAVRGEWDLLISIETQRSQLLEQMKPVDAVVKLDDTAQRRKLQLIEKILAADTAIRNLTQTWMSQLELNIDSSSNEQRLRQAYGI